MTTRSFWSKITMLLMVSILVMPMLAACDDDDDDDGSEAEVLELAATPRVETQLAETEVPFVDDPIKIGAIMDWSGPTAMAGWLGDGVINFAQWYWNEEQGGIVVGDVRRPIEFVRYDSKGQIAGASGAAKKALLDECTAVIWGGVTNQYCFPVGDVTDPAGVLFSGFNNPKEAFEDYTYYTNSIFDQDARNDLCARLAVEKLQAKTVGLVGYNLASNADTLDAVEARLEELDPEIEVVCKELYDPALKDFTPLLTKLRYENPDVLIVSSTDEGFTAMANQMPGLGGWGDIEFIAWAEHADFHGIEETPGADGWYLPVMWMPDSGTPGARAWGDAWAQMCAEDSAWCKKYSSNSSTPMPTQGMMYNPITTAIKAIELAGSDDPLKVAQAAISGNLEYDSALGMLHINPNGKSDLSGFFIQMKDGQRVPVDIQ